MPDREPIGTSHHRHVDPRGTICVVTFEWAVIGGQIHPDEVRITANGVAVDATMLRSIPLAKLADEERPKQVKNWEGHLKRPELSEADRRRVQRVIDAGRSPLDDAELLAEVAAIYRNAALSSRAPTKLTYEALVKRGRPYSRQQVGKLVMRSRELGLLGKAARGKGGEQPKSRRSK